MRNAHADLFLSLFAVKRQFFQKHFRLFAGTLQAFLDFQNVALEALGLQGTVNFDDLCPEVVDIGIYLVGEFVASGGPSFGRIPFIDRGAALSVNFFRIPFTVIRARIGAIPLTVRTRRKKNEIQNVFLFISTCFNC